MATIDRLLLDRLNGPGFETLRFAPGPVREIIEDPKQAENIVIRLVPTEYKRRDRFSGPALTTTGFFEALDEGLSFTPDRYREEITTLILKDASITERRYAFLVRLIQRYPGMVKTMMSYVDDDSSPLKRLIPALYGRDVDALDSLFFFATVKLLEGGDDEREERLLSLPTTATQTLFGLYGTDSFEEIFSLEPDPLESYLFAISDSRLEEVKSLVAGFGMLIPEHLPPARHRSYALKWLPNYKKILTRREPTPVKQPNTFYDLLDTLSTWTDQEILTELGLPDYFNTRNALIDGVYRVFSEEGFLVLTELKDNRTTNYLTTVSTKVEELKPPYLVFGTPLNYRALELNDLVAAWENVGRGHFPKVEKDGLYTIAQISRLSSLLTLFDNVTSNHLLETIERGLLSGMRREAQVDELMRDISGYNCSGVRELFAKLFYLGMYMRGWRGPGESYPPKGTEGENIKTVLLRSEIETAIQQLDERTRHDFKKLPGVTYQRQAHALIFGPPLVSSLHDSETLIASGSYYGAVVFSDIQRGFSLLS